MTPHYGDVGIIKHRIYSTVITQGKQNSF